MKIEPIVFDKLPVHDTCWSLITGVDGKIYICICGEMTGGLSAYIVSYDPETDKVEYLLEVAKVLGIPEDSGEAAHANFRNGFHNVLHDVTPSPDGESVYGITWTFGERLFCYNFKKRGSGAD